MPEQNILRWAAQRAANDPLFLGRELREYREANELTESELARYLQCPIDGITKLALCLSPDPNDLSFRAHVEQIAIHCGASSQRLAELLREVDAVRAMRSGSNLGIPLVAARSGLLMAARDRRRRGRERYASRKRKPK